MIDNLGSHKLVTLIPGPMEVSIFSIRWRKTLRLAASSRAASMASQRALVQLRVPERSSEPKCFRDHTDRYIR